MGKERNKANRKCKTKLITLEILLYQKRKEKEIKDRVIRDIWTLLETEEE